MTEEAIVTHMLFWAKSYREGQSNGQYCIQGILTPEANPPKDTSTPSNRPRDKLSTLDIVSHYVNGAKERLSADMTRTTTKFETIAAHMLNLSLIHN